MTALWQEPGSGLLAAYQKCLLGFRSWLQIRLSNDETKLNQATRADVRNRLAVLQAAPRALFADGVQLPSECWSVTQKLSQSDPARWPDVYELQGAVTALDEFVSLVAVAPLARSLIGA